PPGAEVIDCRPSLSYDAWHYEGARNLELHELLEDLRGFDKQRTYVIYCPVGLQSAVAAERLQRAGYNAFSFKGGADALRRFAEKREAHLERDGLPSAEKINLGEKSE